MKRKAQIGMLLIVIIIILAAIWLFNLGSGFLAIVSSFDFAGFTFEDIEEKTGCNVGGFSSSVQREGEFIIIKGDGVIRGERKIRTEVTGIDELLIIYDGYGTAFCSNGYPNAGTYVFGKVIGSSGGEISGTQGTSTSRCSSNSDSVSVSYQPSIWKFKNNFDGTWSSMKSIGVGDIFIRESTAELKGDRQYLEMGVLIGVTCGNRNGGTSRLRIYNIVRKENAFAVCKANEVLLADGGCQDLKTILLNSEEAIKESYDEKFIRLQAELEAKQSGLTAENEQIKQQLQELYAQGANQQQINEQIERINMLESELKETKSTLADIQAKDKSVVNAIESQEKFEKPNLIKRFFNKAWAFIKSWFS